MITHIAMVESLPTYCIIWYWYGWVEFT